MQITGVNQYNVEYGAEGSFQPTWIPGYPQGTHEVALFEIETDDGITGYGAMPSFAGGLDFADPLSFFLVGEDPQDVEGILGKLDSINLVGPKPWGVEIALWISSARTPASPSTNCLEGPKARSRSTPRRGRSSPPTYGSRTSRSASPRGTTR